MIELYLELLDEKLKFYRSELAKSIAKGHYLDAHGWQVYVVAFTEAKDLLQSIIDHKEDYRE